MMLSHPERIIIQAVHHLGHISGHAQGFDDALIRITPRICRCAIAADILQFDVSDIERGEVFDHNLRPPLVKNLRFIGVAIEGQCGLRAITLSPSLRPHRGALPWRRTWEPYHTCVVLAVNWQISIGAGQAVGFPVGRRTPVMYPEGCLYSAPLRHIR
jgi:hypothetical protein